MIRRRTLIVLGSFLLCGILFWGLRSAIQDTPEWDAPQTGLGNSDSQLTQVTTGLFEDQVLALEVLGVLLTACMFGALVIARPLGSVPDKTHYTAAKGEELKAVQAISTVPKGALK